MTTTLGADLILNFTPTPTEQELNPTLDLMQLILNEPPKQPSKPSLSSALLTDLLSTLEKHFSSTLLQHWHCVPFMPLDLLALEKIMRHKIKIFANHLESRFNIELNYTPDIFTFLAQEALTHKPMEKMLSCHLYPAIANEMLTHSETKNRPKRLLLRLNDNGQLLRCEVLNKNEVPA